MPRSQVAIVGALLVAIVLAIVWRAHQQSSAPEEPHSSLPASAAASSPSSVPEVTQPSPAPESSNVLPDGRKVPELPADAPKSVSFAVVLVTYRGAEGAPPDAREKSAALAKAKELLPDARRDFDEAVKKGDPGSTTQAGTMPRDVLEPGLEYVLFTLKKGEVYGEPIDTPRGYWILRRND
jgi:cytoskeletal protein RodZ